VLAILRSKQRSNGHVGAGHRGQFGCEQEGNRTKKMKALTHRFTAGTKPVKDSLVALPMACSTESVHAALAAATRDERTKTADENFMVAVLVPVEVVLPKSQNHKILTKVDLPYNSQEFSNCEPRR
jgi:hypothetical protein